MGQRVTDYANEIAAAVTALAGQGAEAAREALIPIADQTWTVRVKHRRRSPSTPTSPFEGAGSRSFRESRSAATFVRDGFACVHCGVRVVARPLAVLLHDVSPTAIKYHKHYKRGAIHPLFWTNVAEADHLVPGSLGGSWDDLSNHVTACVLCDATKADAEAQGLGRAASDQARRDGLIPFYRRAWEQAGRPRRAYHAKWLRAFEGNVR